MNKLEDIGFYTLSDKRAKSASMSSALQRCELLLTHRCNFRCPYCRGMGDYSGDIPFDLAKYTVDYWISQNLNNVRFSGGEPTLYKNLNRLAARCRHGGVDKVAVSSNGSAKWEVYKELISCGVNDFSISLDACCATTGEVMSGTDKWKRTVENIARIAELTYTTVGVVLTRDNIREIGKIVEFADGLGVDDIRIIPAAQFGKTLPEEVEGIEKAIRDKMPILDYRINNLMSGMGVRGISEGDCNRCYLAMDDMVSAQGYHFQCIIHFREGGKPIGKIGPDTRRERFEFAQEYNTYEDKICRNNCLDVCVDYNNRVKQKGQGRSKYVNPL